MTPTIAIDTTAFSATLKRLTENVRQDAKEVVKQEAGLFAEAAARGTPPSGNRPMMTDWSVAKRIGTSRIKSQSSRVFKSLFDQPAIAGDKKTIRKIRYLFSHDKTAAVRQILESKGISFRVVIEKLNEEIYDQNRDQNGKCRLLLSPDPVLVAKAASISSVVRNKIKHLGKGKSGWARAMALAGRKFPSWIAEKSGSGWATEHNTPDSVVWEIADSVPHIQAAGANKRIIERTYKFRAKRMELRIANILKKRLSNP